MGAAIAILMVVGLAAAGFLFFDDGDWWNPR